MRTPVYKEREGPWGKDLDIKRKGEKDGLNFCDKGEKKKPEGKAGGGVRGGKVV